MLNNVCHGSEWVGGQGGATPDFTYAALYRLRKWRTGKVEKLFEGGKFVSRSENVGKLFE
jgi:hypothetical protein